jgi:amino acid adenylation domain-containing protein
VPQCGPSVDALVQHWVSRQPDFPALYDPSTGSKLTYGQLWERSGWVASDLARRGVARGDVVAMTLGRSIELVIAMVGILRTGAAYLPLDAHAPSERIATILGQAQAGVVVGPAGQTWPTGSDSAQVAAVALPGCAPLDCPPAPGPSGTGGDDPCYVIYTSGSTGTPKGVIVPHRAVVRLVTRPHYCVVAPGDRCANAANPAFDATTFEIWGALTAGATVVIFPSVLDLAIDDWVALTRGERITTMFLTTSLFHTVAREQPAAFGSLANLVVGGEQLEITTVRRVLAAGPPGRLVNGYGPTETTTFASYFDCTPDSLNGLDRVPVGFPLQDTSLHVLDDELDQVPPGETGELYIGGPGVALGYTGLPELTAERFISEPATGRRLYRTGDLARVLRSGAVELLGRRDRQVKLRGFRIELEEIEQSAMATGLCDTVAVEKIGDGPAAFLAGFVLPSALASPGAVAEELGARLAGQLPGYMIPARWILLTSMPFGPTGKLDRARLAELAAQSPSEAAGEDADDADDAVGMALRQIWQDVLEVPRARPADSFIGLGGNSIMAVQVASRIADQLDVLVEPGEVLLAGSLGDLARQLRAAVTATA